MNHAMMTRDHDSEQLLLSHLELCYSVALALTRNVNLALALTKDTLLWAWQRNDGSWDEDIMKKSLLRELRDRYLRDYQLAGGRGAAGEQRLPKVEE